MKYVIVNNSTWDEFYNIVKALQSKGYVFTFSYVEHAKDHEEIPGGWGCVRFADILPSEILFPSPDVEYRYSKEKDAWLVDGVFGPYSEWVKTLHAYFVTLEGQ